MTTSSWDNGIASAQNPPAHHIANGTFKTSCWLISYPHSNILRVKIPNNGIIRYLGMFNKERLFITSPKALSEVLTTKSYDYKKPIQVVAGIGRVLGVGILLAEGDEHRFQRYVDLIKNVR